MLQLGALAQNCICGWLIGNEKVVGVAARQGLKPTPNLPDPRNERLLWQPSQLAQRPNSPGCKCLLLFWFEFQYSERQRGQDLCFVVGGNDRNSWESACRNDGRVSICGSSHVGLKARSIGLPSQRHCNLPGCAEEPFASSNVQHNRCA